MKTTVNTIGKFRIRTSVSASGKTFKIEYFRFDDPKHLVHAKSFRNKDKANQAYIKLIMVARKGMN